MEENTVFHFIGIGGISMSALAVLLMQKGYAVQGSNLEHNEETEMLLSRGVRVFLGHEASHVENATVVVFNSAISSSNPELVRAKEKNLLILTRAQMLGSIAKEYSSTIAVCGSHGKTTTTSMIGHILECAGKKPTVHVGGVMINYHSNFLIGKQDIFVTEACEYKNNFHALSPTTLVVLNIESDHLDFFANYAAIEQSFQTMVNKSESVVIYSSNSLSLPQKTVYFCSDFSSCHPGEVAMHDNKALIHATNLCCDTSGKYTFDCMLNSSLLGTVSLGLPCKHNVANALAAIATCLNYGVKFETVCKALSSFKGVKRRFEIMGKIGKALAVHDYAHHPTEIASTIGSARNFVKGKIWVVFQPHTYSRTLTLMPEFLSALMQADELIILPTYAAREERILGGDASDLSKELRKMQCNVYEALRWEDAEQTLEERVEENDIILLLGAGSIVHFHEHYQSLKSASKP